MGQGGSRWPEVPEEIARRMVRALFDTNIVIDHLRGLSQARDEIRRHEDKAISVVTWMEVMVGATPTLLHATQSFLEGFRVSYGR